MPHSTARTLDAESARAPRSPLVTEPRPRREAPAARRAHRLALADELRRLEYDIGELCADFDLRIKPLTRAYAKTTAELRKLKHIACHKPREKRR